MVRQALAAIAIVTLAACAGQAPATTGPTADISASTRPTASPAGSPTEAARPTPAPTPMPTTVALPDGLDRFAWVNTTRVLDTEGGVASTRIAGGTLGATSSFSMSVPWEAGFGFTWTATTADVAIAASGHLAPGADLNASELRIWRATDGSLVSDLTFPGLLLGNAFDSAPAAIDVDRSFVYFAVKRAGGGVDIGRQSFDGSAATTIVRLDDRFTAAEAFPTERFTFGLDPSGTLVVLACAKADGCRLWEIEPDAKTASAPRPLPAATPTVCSGLAASERWLVVADDAVCSIDVGDAPFPMRAIDRLDGTTHSIGDESQVYPARIIETNGREVAVAAKRSADWSVSSVMTIDLESGARTTVAGPFENGDQTWLGLDPIVLPGGWVLVEPWGLVDAPGASIPAGRLVNIATHEVIELPAGTFGWR